MQETLLKAAHPGTRPRRRNAWIASLLLLAAAAFLVYRGRQAGFDLREFALALRSVHWGWIAAAWLAGLLTYVGRTIRWMVMLRPLAPSARFRDVLSSTVIGFTAVFLFGRPGELVRPWLIARATGASFPSQVAAWVLERIYDTLLILAFFGYALASSIRIHPSAGPEIRWLLARGGWIIGLTALLCLAALVLLQHWAPRFEQRIVDGLGFLQSHHQERASRLVRAALDGLRAARSGTAIAQLLFWSVVEWGIIYFCFHFTFLAFPETATLAPTQVLAYIGFVGIGSIIQIPGLGGGFQVASILITTELFRVPMEVAASLAMLNWIVAFAGAVPFGLVLAVREGLRWGQLSDIEKEALS
ncbi:MAG: flippase-like domain-containing protein [Bryobacteraceae bacterium]|nr:flippase-like domain-containing protein [Bryobacteraceae bacterium]